MSEPIVYFGIGFLLATLLIFGIKALAPNLMADIEADMGEPHVQIAAATRRLETSVQQMKVKTAGQLSDECIKLEQEIANMKRQVEETWAAERMANAVLRERINDVAGEVVRVAHALEGLGSPIETMLAGKASELAAALGAPGSGNGGAPVSSITTGGEDSKVSLAYRIRSLQKRAARVASDGGT
jgi:hypothetical protein